LDPTDKQIQFLPRQHNVAAHQVPAQEYDTGVACECVSACSARLLGLRLLLADSEGVSSGRELEQREQLEQWGVGQCKCQGT
jgi:hypothetical protein